MHGFARAAALLLAGWAVALCAGVHRAGADDPRYAGHGPPTSAIEAALRDGEFRSAKPVGTSSVVLKVDLPGDIDAAFRPESRLNPRGHLAEVAAYRLGRALHLDNVAPAVPRTVPWRELAALIRASRPEALASLSHDIVVQGGQVRGAAIYWIPELYELGLDTAKGIARFSRWLAQPSEPLSEREERVAAQLSIMLSFDYLIGNFDRFSGANLQGDKAGTTVFLRDHNMAFFEPLRTTHHQRVLRHLKHAQRFSRSFVRSVHALTPALLSGALADSRDGPGFHVLTSAQMRSLSDRRAALLSYIAALIDTYGERNVLTFR